MTPEEISRKSNLHLHEMLCETEEKLTAALELLKECEKHLDKHKGYSMPVKITCKLIAKIKAFRGQDL